MKQIIYLIAALALLVGVSSCKTDCPEISPDPVETDLTVTTPEIKIKKGEKATIGYTVTPKETRGDGSPYGANYHHAYGW